MYTGLDYFRLDKVPMAHDLMMGWAKVFGVVVCFVFRPLPPKNIEFLFALLVPEPMKSHVP